MAGAGGWLGSIVAPLTGAIASIGTYGIMAIVGGIVSASSYLYPRIAKLLNSICRSRDIAKCEFEADGEHYIAVFSLSSNRWQLMYKDGRWTKSDVNVPDNDVALFFTTDFFHKFLGRCGEYIDAIYQDPKRMECLEVLAKMADKKS